MKKREGGRNTEHYRRNFHFVYVGNCNGMYWINAKNRAEKGWDIFCLCNYLSCINYNFCNLL